MVNKSKLCKTLNYWFLKSLGIISPPHFAYDFLRKIYLTLYSIKWPNFIAGLHLLLEILVNMSFCNCCLWHHKFWKWTLSFQSSRFSTWPKSQDKTLNILKLKELWRWSKNRFWSSLKGFQLPNIDLDLRVRLWSSFWKLG